MANDNRTGLEIAVIGMAGRFPGAKNLTEFWNNLQNGVESISFFTDEELLAAGVDPLMLKNPNYVKAAGMLQDSEYFDPFFFGYTPREAEIMDPQFRFLHECVWEALEDAGCNPDTYSGLIGIYAGAAFNHGWLTQFLRSGRDVAELYEINHLNGHDHLSTRIAYKLNLKGPAVTVQTACSTSLVAVDQACRGLLTGQCDLALAGGVTVTFLQKMGYLYHDGMIFSPDGHCRAFDALAKGTVGGNGVGIVALKRLADAEEDGDTIYAVIKGSAANNDGGRKVGYSAPSVEGQVEVIKTAQFMAEVEPESISYIEAHGTGTPLGDPIEMEALRLAFKTEKRQYCAVGSVKTNIGHVDTAAGVAGLIKTVLALKHKKLPPSLHFSTPNPKIDFQNSPFYVNTQLRPWEANPRRAGVCSFGIGGTNAHVILEEADDAPFLPSRREHVLICLSAKTPAALTRAGENFAHHLRENPELNLADAAYTLHTGRKEFKYRQMLVAKQPEEVVNALESMDALKVFTAAAEESRPVVLLFPGQGSQYVNMARGLYEVEPDFREIVDKCCKILKTEGLDVQNILYPKDAPTEAINETAVTQPLLFVIEYALAALLRSWGIKPYAAIGHSIGEYTAACLAGVFTLEDALHLIAMRGKLIQALPKGTMASVELGEFELTQHLTGNLAIAAVNAPELCTVSGPTEEVQNLVEKLRSTGRECQILHTSHAFHSAMLDPILPAFRAEVQKIKLAKPVLPYVSNVTGTWITEEQATNPEYWVQHLRGTVRFADGFRSVQNGNECIFIEVGPGLALATFARKFPEKKGQVWNLLRHPKQEISDMEHLLNRLGQLWLAGVKIDWQAFYAGEKRRRIPLPTYPFEKMHFPFKLTEGMKVETPGRTEKSAVTTLYTRTELPANYVAPESEMEIKLAQILQNLLGIDHISIHENFFELGIDSLKAVSLAAKIQKEIGAQISLNQIFGTPTIGQLAACIKEVDGEKQETVIPRQPQKDYYRLSYTQKRLWMYEQIAGATSAYNMPGRFALHEKVEPAQIQRVLDTLDARHESLRTHFRVINAEPYQVIAEKGKILLKEIDLSGFTSEERKSKGDEAFRALAVQTFNLETGPLITVTLLKYAETEFELLFCMHHIISDGWSMEVLKAEFFHCYEAYKAGHEPALPPLPLQYRDYAEWQNDFILSGEKSKKAREYWTKQLSGELPHLNLPLDYARSALKNRENAYYRVVIPAEVTAGLHKVAHEHNASLFMVLLAAFNTLLAKLTGEKNILVAIPAASREHADLRNLIGFFVNTIFLKNYVNPTEPFTNLLQQVQANTLEALEYQSYPLELVTCELKIQFPEIKVFFNMLNQSENSHFELENVTAFQQGIDQEAKFDLACYLSEYANGIELRCCYLTGLFKQARIAYFMDEYLQILGKIATDSTVALLKPVDAPVRRILRPGVKEE